MTRPLLIMLTGDAPPPILLKHGNYDVMFQRMAGLTQKDFQRVHVAHGEMPDRPSDYSGVLITGSPAMVTDRERWSEDAAGWLRTAVDAETPILGVCYGHQLLAHALGGRIDYHPDGIELGTHDVILYDEADEHPLLKDLPRRFRANLVHRQSVMEIPKGAKVLAHSAQEAHQILSYGPSILTTQFHPEFDGAIMRSYIVKSLEDDSVLLDRYRLHAPKSEDTPVPRMLLHRFVLDCLEAG